MMDNKDKLEKICGRVASVVYASPDSGYAVLRVVDENEDLVTVVGSFPLISPGESIISEGEWTTHPSYGKQFSARSSERRLPSDPESIYDFLISKNIKGIGTATASLMVTCFGEYTIDVIMNSPQKLTQIKGISLNKAIDISNQLKKVADLRYLMEKLAKLGIPSFYALKAYQRFGEDTLEKIYDNPYLLCLEGIGLPFDKADEIAFSEGMDSNTPSRIEAAILHELHFNSQNGHVFIPVDKLISATSDLIDVEQDLIGNCLENLILSGDICRETIRKWDCIYLSSLYSAETYCAKRLKTMGAVKYKKIDVTDIISSVENKSNVKMAEYQIAAVSAAAENQLMILTGGPGTGKTTCVRAILELFDSMDLITFLAAPTGRAARRLASLTGRKAYTIHRLLECTINEDTHETVFNRNEDDLLRCDALIVDETSMLDINLLKALLLAINQQCKLIFVGDVDQLPSVGPGNVLRDIIYSHTCETIRLTQVFRQSDSSNIFINAQKINSGVCPDLKENKNGFYFLRRDSADSTASTIVDLFSNRLPNNLKIPLEDIQVLTPSRKGNSGSIYLNQILQEKLNPPDSQKKEVIFMNRIYREGDRVMQISNNYEIGWISSAGENGNGVYNGDTGYIRSIDIAAQTVFIEFEDKTADYPLELLNDLEHAWAITVHKSQGSEYRAVILSVAPTAKSLIYRGLLYTAVSRASENLVIVGNPDVIYEMTENNVRSKRYSGLRIRLEDDI